MAVVTISIYLDSRGNYRLISVDGVRDVVILQDRVLLLALAHALREVRRLHQHAENDAARDDRHHIEGGLHPFASRSKLASRNQAGDRLLHAGEQRQRRPPDRTETADEGENAHLATECCPAGTPHADGLWRMHPRRSTANDWPNLANGQ